MTNFTGLTVGDLRRLIADLPDETPVIASRGEHIYASANEGTSDNDVRVEAAIWHDPSDADFDGDEYGWGDGYWETPNYLNETSASPALVLGYSS